MLPLLQFVRDHRVELQCRTLATRTTNQTAQGEEAREQKQEREKRARRRGQARESCTYGANAHFIEVADLENGFVVGVKLHHLLRGL